MGTWLLALVVVYAGVQVAYLATSAVSWWFLGQPVDLVQPPAEREADLPPVMLLYPVLREPEETMRTTMTAVGWLDYPPELYRVVAVVNADDEATTASLVRLQAEFAFLEVMAVPPTTHPTWAPVWQEWQANPKAYWWHAGARAGVRDLPAKKTRQLVYALYHLFTAASAQRWLLTMLDADSAPPPDLFRLAAAGVQRYDVVQATNVAGNALQSLWASWYASDHVSWDASLWRHMSAGGRHPYWVLGKGVFYRVSDLLELGGFHPWTAIEDPEVGMRLWVNGRRLGVLPAALVEEVPDTFAVGTRQRTRWVAGFLQSLGRPLAQMGMRPAARWRARLNAVPCFSLVVNAVGLPVGLLVLAAVLVHPHLLPTWLVALSLVNLVAVVVRVVRIDATAWRVLAPVLDRQQRVRYLLRTNPLSQLVHWTLWVVPLVLGVRTWLREGGGAWEPTLKKDQTHEVVRATRAGSDPAAAEASGSGRSG